jgi:predicted transcriptional regulator of viral defense system
MGKTEQNGSNWDRLYEIASAQEGLFTTQQAGEAGYSSQLIDYHIRAKRVVRVRRGIYRLVHFPAGEHEEFVVAWLWTDSKGIISHQTALSLHGLSDILPAQIHLTLPDGWRRRRFRVPEGIVLYYADVPEDERSWFGSVPITKPNRTLNDCALAGLSPELLQQAARQALERGIVSEKKLDEVKAALEPFGGIES